MMSGSRALIRMAVCCIEDEKLVQALWQLAEEEEKHERWEEEKKRRHEVSLDGDEKIVTKIEFELANRKEEFINGITKDDLYCALSKLDVNEMNLMHLIYFQYFSERHVARLYHCSQNAIHKRKIKILKKLRLLLND